MGSGGQWWTRLVVGLSLLSPRRAFYIPGVAPVEFGDGDPIDVKGVKLTSMKTQLPYEFYSVPFCKPAGGEIQYKSENLGEILRGDRIVNTAYSVRMKKDVQCRSLCQGSDAQQLTKADADTLRRRIRQDYHVHLLIDNLPCATRLQLPGQDDAYYDHGYKLGYTTDDGKLFVNNHLELRLKYHQHAPNEFRVVGFEVSPRSVAWDAVKVAGDGDYSCTGDLSKAPPQEVVEGDETRLHWTYSVVWEESELRWASRWDTYLAMRDVQIHWFSIVNSIVVVLCLSGFLSIIIIRTIRKDIAAYNADEEAEDTLEETGWKLVHGDVFRPPRRIALLVAVVGSGLQLCGVVLVTLFFAMLGMLSPSSRGSLMSVALFLYCFGGTFGGYFAGRLYKTLRGLTWKRAALLTALLFPGLVFGSGFILNFFIWGKASSGAVPFSTMLSLLSMWLLIDLPLVFLGFYFGFRKHPYSHPVRTNQIPRQVPIQPWYLHRLPSILLSGILPFGALFLELFFIFTASFLPPLFTSPTFHPTLPHPTPPHPLARTARKNTSGNRRRSDTSWKWGHRRRRGMGRGPGVGSGRPLGDRGRHGRRWAREGAAPAWRTES